MFIDQLQKGADGFFVEMIDSFRAVCFYLHESASEEPLEMMRNKALLISKLFCNVGCTVRLFDKKMNNIPPRLIAKGLKKELVRLIKIYASHNMNYISYS